MYIYIYIIIYISHHNSIKKVWRYFDYESYCTMLFPEPTHSQCRFGVSMWMSSFVKPKTEHATPTPKALQRPSMSGRRCSNLTKWPSRARRSRDMFARWQFKSDLDMNSIDQHIQQHLHIYLPTKTESLLVILVANFVIDFYIPSKFQHTNIYKQSHLYKTYMICASRCIYMCM